MKALNRVIGMGCLLVLIFSNMGHGFQKKVMVNQIKDIEKHRCTPNPFVLSPSEKVELDLENVDFNAPVLARVNGFPITQDLFKAYLSIYMGAPDLDRYIFAMLADIGKKTRMEDGADPIAFKVTEEMVDEQINKQLTLQVKMNKSPMMDLKKFRKDVEASFGWERFREKIRSMLIFEKVYLPEACGASKEKVKNATGQVVDLYLPAITWYALSADESNHPMRDLLNKQYAEKTPIMDIMRLNYTRIIKDALLKSLDVKYFYDGDLNPGILLKIENKSLPTEEVYNLIKDRIGLEDRMMALREILVLKSMDQALHGAGRLPSSLEANQGFASHQKEYEGTLFTLDFMIQLSGYANMACYRNVYKRRIGFEKLIQSDLNSNQVLKDYYEGGARLLYERGNVKIQIIFFGVFDRENNLQREGGYAWAEKRMSEVLKKLKNGAAFEDLVKEYMGKDAMNIDPLNRLNLRKALGDSAKSALFSGFSLADYIFYRAKPNEIIGPVTKRYGLAGNPYTKGVYLIKVHGFQNQQKLKSFESAKTIVMTDYADLRFVHWAQEALKNASIELIEKK